MMRHICMTASSTNIAIILLSNNAGMRISPSKSPGFEGTSITGLGVLKTAKVDKWIEGQRI